MGGLLRKRLPAHVRPSLPSCSQPGSRPEVEHGEPSPAAARLHCRSVPGAFIYARSYVSHAAVHLSTGYGGFPSRISGRGGNAAPSRRGGVRAATGVELAIDVARVALGGVAVEEGQARVAHPRCRIACASDGQPGDISTVEHQRRRLHPRQQVRHIELGDCGQRRACRSGRACGRVPAARTNAGTAAPATARCGSTARRPGTPTAPIAQRPAGDADRVNRVGVLDARFHGNPLAGRCAHMASSVVRQRQLATSSALSAWS